uniref:Ribosomal protein L6 n=1 Tax=Storeatula sp. CCMP1868 TaxID=195070 RepID=A0A2P1G880_9CRYP|nr:ribosomal protein L6 [Storeatula sp. CCMP1868]AVM81150.1 ribosomal protein L6 [Storeatula sp. CCMP1868]
MKKSSFFIYPFKSFLIFGGLKGRIVIKIKSLEFDLFFNQSQIYLVRYNAKLYNFNIVSLFLSNFQGVNFCFSQKLNLIGVGFRCWVVFEKKKKFLIVKTSLSKDCFFYIPQTIDLYCLNATTIFIRGIRKLDINFFIYQIKKIKKPNFYKKKGIFLENEIVKLKIGKKM